MRAGKGPRWLKVDGCHGNGRQLYPLACGLSQLASWILKIGPRLHKERMAAVWVRHTLGEVPSGLFHCATASHIMIYIYIYIYIYTPFLCDRARWRNRLSTGVTCGRSWVRIYDRFKPMTYKLDTCRFLARCSALLGEDKDWVGLVSGYCD